MTSRELLMLVLRRWYILVLGLSLTGGVGWLALNWAPRVYWAATTVTVMQAASNPLEADSFSLTGIASMLVLRANDGELPNKTSSPSTTMYGEGILDGDRVRLRDPGGQWSTMIDQPVFFIEATGPSAAVVESRMRARSEAVSEDLELIQEQLGVPHQRRVFLRFEPASPTAAIAEGNPLRGVAAIGVVGVVLTGIAVALSDVPRRRRRHRSSDGSVDHGTGAATGAPLPSMSSADIR